MITPSPGPTRQPTRLDWAVAGALIALSIAFAVALFLLCTGGMLGRDL